MKNLIKNIVKIFKIGYFYQVIDDICEKIEEIEDKINDFMDRFYWITKFNYSWYKLNLLRIDATLSFLMDSLIEQRNYIEVKYFPVPMNYKGALV